MVIQRNKKVMIRGKKDAFQPVTVKMQEQTASAFADILSDVQVGEVWLAGGQSNMEFCMRYDADFTTEMKEKQDDSLRFFDYPEVSYIEQIDEVDYEENYGFWRLPYDQTVKKDHSGGTGI